MIAHLLNHLWQSSLCVGGAGLLALALNRNAAKVRFWLWFAASVKFLVPFALLTALGAYLLTPLLPPVAAPSVILMKPLAQPFSAMSPPTAPILTAVPAAAPSLAAPPLTAAPTSPVPAVPALELGSALAALWAAGLLIISIRWLVHWSRIRALLREAATVQLDAPVAVKFSSSRLEPGLVGIFRPVILLPQGIDQQLSQAELRAVLAHELCHWRRHDNLLAAIHMLVEALFWFFPLVWWLGTRLDAERERACDESVLAAGNDPEMYAEGILKVCRAYLQSPLACVAGVSGAGLKKRIDAIMENRLIPQLNAARKFVLGTSAAIALVLPLVLGLAAVPVAQMQAKAAPIASLSPNAPRSADDAASANSALNEPNRNNMPGQGTTGTPQSQSEAVTKGQPETLAPPSPVLSGALPTENLPTPTAVASIAAPANDQPAASAQPVAPGPVQASLDNPMPVKAGSNEPPTAHVCRNTSVFGWAISSEAILMPSFSCLGTSVVIGRLPFEAQACSSWNEDPLDKPGGRLGRRISCPFDVTMNVRLADPADASKMHPGKIVRLAGDFRVATKQYVDYLTVANAKVVLLDPVDRPVAADQPAPIICQPPELVELSKKLGGQRLCVQIDILANLNATGPQIVAALNSPFLRHPFLKDFQNELAGGPDAITCRRGGGNLTCAHNSYWTAMDHPTGPYWSGMPDTTSYLDLAIPPDQGPVSIPVAPQGSH